MNKKSTVILIIGTLVFCTLASEFTMRATNLSLQYLRYSLFYSNYDFAAHIFSPNAKQIYGLRPNTKIYFLGNTHPIEKKYENRKVSINEFAFRSLDWTQKKPPGVFRIFIVGGSNTYGASVSDEDTYPQKLHYFLERLAPGKFQVWNAGLVASVLSQKVEIARRIARDLEPDLIIIQDFINHGRRAFLTEENFLPELKKSDIPRIFRENPELWAENIPFYFSENSFLVKNHNWLIQKFEIYRLINIFINNHFIKLTFPHHHTWDCHYSENECSSIAKRYSAFGEMVNEREFRKFVSEVPKVSVLLFDPISNLFCDSAQHEFRGVRAFSNCSMNKPPEYRVPHPPSYVYDFYVDTIFKFLSENSFIEIPNKKRRIK